MMSDRLGRREAAHQGYTSVGAAIQAARRALRWLRRPGSTTQVAPTHIQAKIRLLKVTT